MEDIDLDALDAKVEAERARLVRALRSKKYLPLYVNEFAFRHNHREDGDMFETVLASC